MTERRASVAPAATYDRPLDASLGAAYGRGMADSADMRRALRDLEIARARVDQETALYGAARVSKIATQRLTVAVRQVRYLESVEDLLGRYRPVAGPPVEYDNRVRVTL